MPLASKYIQDTAEFENYPIYTQNDLGITYSSEGTRVKIWSPKAEQVQFKLYPSGNDSEASEVIDLTKNEFGVWETYLLGDRKNLYYTFRIQCMGEWLTESADMYAKAVGVNGQRGMIVDFNSTNPENWEEDKKPKLENFTDIVLYEMHVRDFTIAKNSGVKHKGKFVGLTEENTKSDRNEKTGLDHIKDLGITHVHLLPVYDFLTVDESDPNKKQYNWGYDPQNYNVPEGWYATDPFNGNIRIKEFKQMVQKMHQSGLRVVMDVVYNHTGVTNESVFEQTIPGYFYRFAPNGHFSNASGCGNEIASERPMVRKYIVDSVVYWATEYKVDGFRFDLMGILDVDTMNAVREALNKVDPTIFIYGEGWTGGLSPYPEEKRAMKHNTVRLNDIASFSDDFRDAIKGHWSSEQERGFVSGQTGYEESIKFGVAAASPHPQINYNWVNYSKHPWSKKPSQTINFVSCHDNHTLWDKLQLSATDANYDQLIKMQKLALGIILTSQGVPLLHAGVEMGRTKNGEHNSYNLPDEINRFDWSLKSKNKGLYNFVKGLIALRRQHPAFRMDSIEDLADHLSFLSTYGPSFLAFHLRNNANNDPWKDIIVAYNAGHEPFRYKIPKGDWRIVADKTRVSLHGIDSISGSEAIVPGISIQILVDEKSFKTNLQ